MFQKNSEKIADFATPNATPKTGKLKLINFTEEAIKAIKPDSKRKEYWCRGLEGLGIRVTPKGNKTWTFVYRFEGKSRRLTIGRFPKVSVRKAFEEYSKAIAKLEYGDDPGVIKVETNQIERQAPTVKELLVEYIEYCKKTGKKSWRHEQVELSRDIVPAIGHMKVHHVKKKHLVPIFSTMIMERNAPIGAKHMFAYVRRMFNMALSWDYIEVNPCNGIKLNIRSNKRDRHLSPKEVYLFWHELDNVDAVPVSKLALKFMLCTATRGIEVRSMQWKDLDMNSWIWTIPKTKNFKMHRVPLNKLAIDVIEEVRKYTGESELVFGGSRSLEPPSKARKSLKKFYRTSFCKVIRKLREHNGFNEPFTPHDLRRTSATIITAMGCPRYWAKLILNHTEHDVTGIYDQYAYDWEKKKGLEVLNYALEQIIFSTSENHTPSLMALREKLGIPNAREFDIKIPENSWQDHQSTFSSPVSYTLSYDLERLE